MIAVLLRIEKISVQSLTTDDMSMRIASAVPQSDTRCLATAINKLVNGDYVFGMEVRYYKVYISLHNRPGIEEGGKLAKKLQEILNGSCDDIKSCDYRRDYRSHFVKAIAVSTKLLPNLSDAIEAAKTIHESTKSAAQRKLKTFMFAGACPEVKKEATQAAVCGVLHSWGLPAEVAQLVAGLTVTENNCQEFSNAVDVNRTSRNLFRGQFTGRDAPPSRISVATDSNAPP